MWQHFTQNKAHFLLENLVMSPREYCHRSSCLDLLWSQVFISTNDHNRYGNRRGAKGVYAFYSDRLITPQLHWRNITWHDLCSAYPECFNAWNPARKQVSRIFLSVWFSNMLSCRNSQQRLQRKVNCLHVAGQSAFAFGNTELWTWNLCSSEHETSFYLGTTSAAKGKKQQQQSKRQKQKTACGCSDVVGHVMQTPLHQWVGG